MQKMFLIGNLTSDPALSATSNGKTVTRFRLAVNRRFNGQNGEKVTDFFRITTFGKMAENCSKYLAKGRKCCVVGELHPDTYTDNEGQTRMSLDVIADEVEFLSSKNDGTAEKPKPVNEADFADIQSDDIPF